MRFPLGKAVSCSVQSRAGSSAKGSGSNFGRFCWKGRNPCPSITHSPLWQLAYQSIRILWWKSGFEVAWAVPICLFPHSYISITTLTLARTNCKKCPFLLQGLGSERIISHLLDPNSTLVSQTFSEWCSPAASVSINPTVLWTLWGQGKWSSGHSKHCNR